MGAGWESESQEMVSPLETMTQEPKRKVSVIYIPSKNNCVYRRRMTSV